MRRCSSTRSRSAPGRVAGACPAAGGGFDHPPPMGGLVPGGVQGGQGGVQVPGREGLAGLVGGLGGGQDVPGGLGGDRRVRPRRGAGAGFPAVGGAVSGASAGWPALAVLPEGPVAGCPASALPSVPGASAGGATGVVAGFQVSAMPGLLPLTRVAVPAFSCASRACRAAAVLIPARTAITATAAPAGWPTGRPGRPLRGCARRRGNGRGGRVCRGVGGAAGRVRGGGAGACHGRDSVSYSQA